jgi:ribosomal protein S18 acetylase RimI-like enzyme
MEYSIVKVDRDNYKMFDDMVFFRINKRERTEQEQAEIQSSDTVYEVLDSENLYVFAAQSEDKFIGWISLVYIPKIGKSNGKGHLFIDELWVNPAFRKKGIANGFMKQADVLSKEINALGLRLYVNTTNDEAIALYEKCGYTSKFGTALFMEKEWTD